MQDTEWHLSLYMQAAIQARKLLDAEVPRKEALRFVTSNIAAQFGLDTLQPKQFSMTISISASIGLAWMECGFPIVEVAPSLAASLMVTRLPRDICPYLKLPWRCFAIKFPGVTSVYDLAIVLQPVGSEKIQLHLYGPKICEIGFEPSLATYADLEYVSTANNDSPIGEGEVKEAMTASKLAGRLLCGICNEMNGFAKEIADGPRLSSSKANRNRKSKLPARWVFRLTRPVKHDFRKAINDHFTGRSRGKLSLQHCVMGHYKWQHYGFDRALRKIIHVEPYWRGPEDAPIAVRSHLIEREPVG